MVDGDPFRLVPWPIIWTDVVAWNPLSWVRLGVADLMAAKTPPIQGHAGGNRYRTSPSVISHASQLRNILTWQMIYSPQPHANRRVPRFRLTDTTPAVLQFQDGRHTDGELHVISRNGGLLLLPKPVHQGSVVKLMFHTHRGPVLGTAEMLIPVTGTQQPFRFVALPDGDQRTLQAAFQSGLYRNTDEEEWMEELRAAVANWNPPPQRRRFFIKLVMGLVPLVACIIYALHIHLFLR
jgi:hypothetical protein